MLVSSGACGVGRLSGSGRSAGGWICVAVVFAEGRRPSGFAAVLAQRQVNGSTVSVAVLDTQVHGGVARAVVGAHGERTRHTRVSVCALINASSQRRAAAVVNADGRVRRRALVSAGRAAHVEERVGEAHGQVLGNKRVVDITTEGQRRGGLGAKEDGEEDSSRGSSED